MKGKFIVAEGLDGTGKSSVLHEIKNLLHEEHAIIFTREPGGLNNSITENIRNLILEESEGIDPLTEAYLFSSSRAKHTKEIKKLLDEGKTVICDRYLYSSLYYQGIMKGLGAKRVFDLNKEALNNIHPDMIVYFVVSDEVRKSRMAQRDELNRLDQEIMEVNSFGATMEYLNIIHSYKSKKTKVEVIDTSSTTPDEAAQKMLQILTDNKYI